MKQSFLKNLIMLMLLAITCTQIQAAQPPDTLTQKEPTGNLLKSRPFTPKPVADLDQLLKNLQAQMKQPKNLEITRTRKLSSKITKPLGKLQLSYQPTNDKNGFSYSLLNNANIKVNEQFLGLAKFFLSNTAAFAQYVAQIEELSFKKTETNTDIKRMFLITPKININGVRKIFASLNQNGELKSMEIVDGHGHTVYDIIQKAVDMPKKQVNPEALNKHYW